jgi:hypothetical protein
MHMWVMKPTTTRFFTQRLQARIQIGIHERVGVVLHHHRLALGGRHLVGNGADLGPDVVGRARAGIVLDVDHRHLEGAGAGQQAGAGVEGGLDTAELHHPGAVGVLGVDQDQGRLGQAGRGGGEAGQLAQGGGGGHGGSPEWM